MPNFFVNANLTLSATQNIWLNFWYTFISSAIFEYSVSVQWLTNKSIWTQAIFLDFEFEEFKDIYLYAHEKGLKGCTTFRFNPEVHQGVLVKEKDLKNTMYTFVLENGEEIEVPGDEEIEYDGETHSAANLFDALKEGYYGKF